MELMKTDFKKIDKKNSIQKKVDLTAENSQSRKYLL